MHSKLIILHAILCSLASPCSGFTTGLGFTAVTRINTGHHFLKIRPIQRQHDYMMCEKNDDGDVSASRRIFAASLLASAATIGSLYVALPTILGPGTRAQVALGIALEMFRPKSFDGRPGTRNSLQIPCGLVNQLDALDMFLEHTHTRCRAMPNPTGRSTSLRVIPLTLAGDGRLRGRHRPHQARAPVARRPARPRRRARRGPRPEPSLPARHGWPRPAPRVCVSVRARARALSRV